MENKLEKIFEEMKNKGYSLNIRVSLSGKCVFDVIDRGDLLVSYDYTENLIEAFNKLYLRLIN